MSEVVERLARIETKLDTTLSTGRDHEKRLRAVEKRQWYHTGGVAVIGFIAAKLGLPGFHIS
jgi:hypothetical protein